MEELKKKTWLLKRPPLVGSSLSMASWSANHNRIIWIAINFRIYKKISSNTKAERFLIEQSFSFMQILELFLRNLKSVFNGENGGEEKMQEEKKKNGYRMIQTQDEIERGKRIEEAKHFAQEIEKECRKRNFTVAQFEQIVESLDLDKQLWQMRASDTTRMGSTSSS